jgi:hypothetical protein
VGAEVRLSGYNKDGVGTQTVTVDYYGKTAAFDVKVAALTGIRVTTAPDKVGYLSGESLDLTGIKATGTWEGAGDAPVTTPVYVSGFDTTALGTQTVIVEALGKQASFTVTVKEPAAPAAWTPAQGGFARNITGIAYGNGTFVAAGYNDDKPNESIVACSADGINWTKSSVIIAFQINTVFFGGGKFIVGGYHTEKGACISESSDGVRWKEQSLRDSSHELGACIGFAHGKNKRGEDVWVAAFSSSKMRYSSGSGWMTPSINGGTVAQLIDGIWSNSISGVLFGDGRFIAFDRAGRYIFSPGGGSWEMGEDTVAFGGRPVSRVIAGGDKLIGVGPNNALGWSSDGITWTAADQVTDLRGDEVRGGDFNGVAYGFGMFAAVSKRGTIIYSRNGFTWTQVASSTFGSTNIRDIAYGDGRFVAVGDNGRIAYSNKVE